MTRRTMPLADLDLDFCPECQDNDLDGDSWDLDGSYVSQKVTCVTCGAEWTDTYSLAFRITEKPGTESGYDVLTLTRP